jgi:hypothetical protein
MSEQFLHFLSSHDTTLIILLVVFIIFVMLFITYCTYRGLRFEIRAIMNIKFLRLEFGVSSKEDADMSAAAKNDGNNS